MKKTITLLLLLGLTHFAMAAASKPVVPNHTMLADGQSPAGTAIFVAGEQLPASDGKVVTVDPYTGKPVLKIPLLHVPVSAGLSLDLTVTNYTTLKLLWGQSNYDSNYYFDEELGYLDSLFPGITAYACGQDEPFFIDPQGNGHLFFASSSSGTTYYSADGWVGHLTRPGSFLIGTCNLNYYSGTLSSPNGTTYVISQGMGGFSPLTEVTNVASDGSAWVKYSYSGENISSILTSSGYNVQFQYTTIPQDSYSGQERMQFVSQISTSDGKDWNFEYTSSVDGYTAAPSILNQINLPDGTHWQLNPEVLPCRGYALAGVEYPNGASQTFTDSCSSNFQQSRFVVSSEQDSNLPTNYSITYNYGSDTNPTTTSVITPTAKNVYTIINDHPNNTLAWDAGLPVEHKVYDPQGQTLYKDVKYSWQPRQFSNDQGGAQPELTQKITTQDGTSYTINNTQFDSYGYVNNTTESSPQGSIQITHTYYEDPNLWVFAPQVTKTLDPTGNVVNEIDNSYNNLGELASMTHNGVTTSYTYDGQGNLASKTNALGQQTTYSNYMAGEPQTTTNALGDTSHAVVTNSGTVTSSTDALGNTTQYQYDIMGRLVKTTPPIGLPTIVQWNDPQPGDETITRGDYSKTIINNGLGMPTQILKEDMNTKDMRDINISYDSTGHKISQALVNSPQAKIFTYDPIGRLTESGYNISSSPPYLTTYHYESDNVESMIDPRGNTTTYHYRSYGNPNQKQLMEVDSPNGINTVISRNAIGQVTAIQQGNFTRTYTYDSHNYLVSATNPETGTTTYQRNVLGQVISKQVGNSGLINYSYSPIDQLTEVDYPFTSIQDGMTIQDPESPNVFVMINGQLDLITNDSAFHAVFLGHEWDNTVAESLIQQTPHGPNISALSLVQLNGSAIFLLYNNTAAWIPSMAIFYAYHFNPNAIQPITQQQLNQYTRGPNLEAPIVNTQVATVSSSGSLAPNLLQNGMLVQSIVGGAVFVVLDGTLYGFTNNTAFANWYGPKGALWVIPVNPNLLNTLPQGPGIQSTALVQTPNGAQYLVYNNIARYITSPYAEKQMHLGGEPFQVITQAQLAQYQQGPIITADAVTDPNVILYTYDADGRTSSVSNSATGWWYQYDPDSNLMKTIYSVDNNVATLSYTYNSMDQRTSMTYPDGTTITYNPNAFGEPTEESPFILDVEYFPNGDIQNFTNTIGVITSYTQNNRQMLNSLNLWVNEGDGINSPISSLTYTYDNDGNVQSIVDNLDSNDSMSFSYNNMNWLTSASGPWGNGSISYDGNGNITSMDIGNSQLNYAYDPFRDVLGSVSGTVDQTFYYDTFGDVTAINKNQFAYNGAQQLVYVSGVNAQSQPFEVAYEYDGNGNRSMVIDGNGDTTDEMYNREDQRLWTDDETSHTATDYLYLNGHVIAKVAHPDTQAGNTSEAHYQHDDLLGSPIVATNNYRLPIWRQPYLPYGQPWYLVSIRPNHSAGYTGKPYDTNTGLSYYGARYYDPEIGRFVSIDPASINPANPVSFNRYAYADNNPYRYIDPTGMFSMSSFFNDLGQSFNQVSIGFSFGASAGMMNVQCDNATLYDQTLYYGGLGAGTVASDLDGIGEAALATRAAEGAGDVASSLTTDLVPYWPENNGFLGSPTTTSLETGTMIDRFGGNEASRYFSPVGTPAAMRALPPGAELQPLRTFEVLQSMEVSAGQAAPAFGQIGLGTQFRSSYQLGELVDQGFLREVNV